MIRVLFAAGQLGALYGGAEFNAALAKFVGRLALKSHRADGEAGREMVELMRSRVPVDTGRLLNGISTRVEDDVVIVEASAVRGDFDYARSVEFGHDVAHGDPLGTPRARRSRAEHGDHADAEPYFLDSAREILKQRGRTMDDAIGDAAGESGL